MADAAAKHRSIRQGALSRRRRLDEEAKEGAAGLLVSGLAQEQKRNVARPRADMQAPAFTKRQGCGIAANFQDDGTEAWDGKRGFSDPERILHRAWQAEDEAAHIEPVSFQTEPIGHARFVGGHRLADPENGSCRLALFQARLLAEHTECGGKTGGSTSITRLGIADFRHAFERQAAFEKRVQIRNPERKRLAAGFIFLALTEAAGVSRLGGTHDARKSTVFDPGYGLSERKYRLPLHGFVGHDGQLPS